MAVLAGSLIKGRRLPPEAAGSVYGSGTCFFSPIAANRSLAARQASARSRLTGTAMRLQRLYNLGDRPQNFRGLWDVVGEVGGGGGGESVLFDEVGEDGADGLTFEVAALGGRFFALLTSLDQYIEAL